jgi:hypothetical protein
MGSPGLVSSGPSQSGIGHGHRRILDAAAADPGELQREAQQPGRDEDKRTQQTEHEVGQFEDQRDEPVTPERLAATKNDTP